MKSSRRRDRGEEIIKLRDVFKFYQLGESVVKAVDGVDLTIKKGDFIAIVGPSGSGKSTMMNMVGALDIATKGDIFLDKINIEHLEESQLAQIRGRRVGFIFQTFNLVPTLTALENVMLPMVFQRIPLSERQRRARELLTEIGLGHRLRHLPGELSGGERQRVAICRALANDPEVILADEPTGNLDSRKGEEVVEMLNDLSEKGKTIIMVTHDLDMARHADKIYKLKDGKIVNH